MTAPHLLNLGQRVSTPAGLGRVAYLGGEHAWGRGGFTYSGVVYVRVDGDPHPAPKPVGGYDSSARLRDYLTVGARRFDASEVSIVEPSARAASESLDEFMARKSDPAWRAPKPRRYRPRVARLSDERFAAIERDWATAVERVLALRDRDRERERAEVSA